MLPRSCPAENANNQKLMAEYEKYQELQARSQKLQEVRLTPAILSHTPHATYVIQLHRNVSKQV